MMTASPVVFPHEPLTPIVGRPNHASIQQLKRELITNAIAIASTHWGGAHGHLGLVLPPAEYQALANVAFVPLVSPVAPVHAGNVTGPQITEANRAFDAQTRDYNLMVAVNTRLRLLLINAVDPMYFARLQDPSFGLSFVTIITMMETLMQDNGIITAEDLEANRASLLTAWDISQPIEELWIKHTAIKHLATAGDEPISDRVIMEQTLVLLHNMGVFTLGLDAWRRLPIAVKTYAAFVIHFTGENVERIKHVTIKDAGYIHHANAVTEKHGANTDGVPQLAAAVQKVTVTPPTAASNNPYQIVTANGTCMFYCWSHGLGLNPDHTSRTCKNQREGHVANSTITSIGNGSTRIMTSGPKPPPKSG